MDRVGRERLAGLERGSGFVSAIQRARGPAASVPLTHDVSWIAENYPLGEGRNVHVSVFLIRAEEQNILIDSGSFYHRESLVRRISGVTAGEGIHSLILSHSDYPHSGNIPAFRRRWGDFEIVASSGEPEIQGLPYARRSRIGGSLEVAGRQIDFLDPPLADRSHTSWIYDRASRVLFVADGFGYHHADDETGLTSRQLPDGFRSEEIYTFHRDTLIWLRYADPPVLMGVLREIFAEREVSWVAPIHGNPIAAEQLDDYLERLEEGVRRIVGEQAV